MLSAAVCIIGPDPKNALFRNHHHHIFLTFWQLKKNQQVYVKIISEVY